MWIASTRQRISMFIHRVTFFSNAQPCLCDFQSARWRSLLQSIQRSNIESISSDLMIRSALCKNCICLFWDIISQTRHFLLRRQVHGILLPKNRVSPRSVHVWCKTFPKRSRCSLEQSRLKSDEKVPSVHEIPIERWIGSDRETKTDKRLVDVLRTVVRVSPIIIKRVHAS